MKKISVFNYNSPREFLVQAFHMKKEKNPLFSLRAYSKKLGFSSPNMLSMILRGERTIKANILNRIASDLDLKPNEKRYFELISLCSKAKTYEEKTIFTDLINKIKPKKNFAPIDLDHFRFIADWYHIAIIEMTNLKGFKYDPKWIAKKLGSSVNVTIIKVALERLIRLGYLIRDADSVIKKAQILDTPSDIPNEALKSFHSQMINKSLNALYKHSVESREISSRTFTIDSSKITYAKQLIRDFQLELSEKVGCKQGDETYQLNLQFFCLTEGDTDENH